MRSRYQHKFQISLALVALVLGLALLVGPKDVSSEEMVERISLGTPDTSQNKPEPEVSNIESRSINEGPTESTHPTGMDFEPDDSHYRSTRADQYTSVTRQTRATTKRENQSTKPPTTTQANEDAASAKKKTQKTRQEIEDEEDDEDLERERARRRRLKHRYEEDRYNDDRYASDGRRRGPNPSMYENFDRRRNMNDDGYLNRYANNQPNQSSSLRPVNFTNDLPPRATTDLDPRSPSMQRIMNVFNDGKVVKPAKFMTTTMPPNLYNPNARNPAIVQPTIVNTRKPILEQVGPLDLMGANHSSPVNLSASDLDWTKLVKVVFKAPKDNQTLYTLVVNSSELNNQPINDWSTEVPQLLARDFDKLMEKWSTVFPPGHLLLDLGRILADRASPSSNREFLNKLNESLSASFPSNGSLVNVTFSVGPNTTLRPSVDLMSTATTANQSLVRPDQDSSYVLANKSNNSFVSSSPKMMPTANGSQPQAALNHSPYRANSTSNLLGGAVPDVKRNDVLNFADATNKSYNEIVKDLNAEHVKIEDDVKEQAQSLRHFIIICSVVTVISTSIVVAVVFRLFKG